LTIDKRKVALIMLACRDYEAMEVSLACHMEFADPDVKTFILQNCFGDYDAERTLQVSRRYEKLYPGRIEIVDQLGERTPYDNIRRLLDSDIFAPFSHVIKVDDDAFPIRAGWIADMIACWDEAEILHGSDLGYITPLINNNCWGFKQIIDQLGLAAEYYAEVARPHRVGSGDEMNPYRVLSHNDIFTGANGTIWGSPHVARWLHEKTTLQPEIFIEGTRGLGNAYVNESERYSIGAMLFRKTLWGQISELAGDETPDDEHLVHMYCKNYGKKIVCVQSVPFVHFAYFSQRSENRDIVPRARDVYQRFTGVGYPIAQTPDRLLEIEARLRWLETRKGALQPTIAQIARPTCKTYQKSHIGKRLERSLKKIFFSLGLRKKPII
jgi:hypothetical protein